MKSIEQDQEELNSLARVINLLIGAYQLGKKELDQRIEERDNPFKAASKEWLNKNYFKNK